MSSNNAFGDLFDTVGRVFDSGLEKFREIVIFQEEIKDLRRNGLNRTTNEDFFTGGVPDFGSNDVAQAGGFNLRGGAGQVLMLSGLVLAVYLAVKD